MLIDKFVVIYAIITWSYEELEIQSLIALYHMQSILLPLVNSQFIQKKMHHTQCMDDNYNFCNGVSKSLFNVSITQKRGYT